MVLRGRSLVGVLAVLPATHALAAYTAMDLSPNSSYTNGQVSAAAGGYQGGYATAGTGSFAADHALLWSGTAASYVDLTPTATAQRPAASSADVLAMTPSVQAGQANFPTGATAGYWTGTANSFIALPTGGLLKTEVLGAADAPGGSLFVGDDQFSNQALLWTPQAGAYTRTNLHNQLPAGAYVQSEAQATDGVTAVGQATSAIDGQFHAIAWNIATQTSVDLTGSAVFSDARGVAGNIIAGYSGGEGPLVHATLWTFDGTQYAATDLNPAEAEQSQALATTATKQAGYAIYDEGGNPHAMVWLHGAGGVIMSIDLEGTLDPNLFVGSEATGIDSNGDIVGAAFDNNGSLHPMLWTVSTPEPASLGMTGIGTLALLRRRRPR